MPKPHGSSISEGDINYSGVSTTPILLRDLRQIGLLMDINLTFTDSAGDIDICLLDSAAPRLSVPRPSPTMSTSTILKVSSGGTYYLYVYGGNCNSYTLWGGASPEPPIFFDDFETQLHRLDSGKLFQHQGQCPAPPPLTALPTAYISTVHARPTTVASTTSSARPFSRVSSPTGLDPAARPPPTATSSFTAPPPLAQATRRS